MNPEHRSYRFVVLLFTCLVTFGSYFCFDMPSVLQKKFEMNTTCPEAVLEPVNSSTANVTECCSDCLGMTSDQYNLLYAVYAWTNAVVVLGTGYFIDKTGNMVSLPLFSFTCLLGAGLFALGTMFAGTAAMLPVMLVGRLVFGAGNGSLTVAQYRLVAFWFRNKEMAMAFGTVLAVSRLGSVLNFLLTENFEKQHGISWTLWGGAALCGVGFISALIASLLDRYGTRQLGQASTIKSQSQQMKLSDIRHFGLRYWMLNLTLVFYYSGVFPFVADSSKFIADKYGYVDSAPYIAGAVYDVSLVFSPFLGFVVDQLGKRGWIILVCSILNVPVFVLLAFTHIHPLVCTIWLGFTYSFIAPSLWPSVPLVVTQATVGTATGITSSLQMVGVGIANVIVGQILGDKANLPKDTKLLRWRYVMIYLLANVAFCVISSGILISVDKRRGGMLNLSKREKEARAALGTSLRATESTEDSPYTVTPDSGDTLDHSSGVADHSTGAGSAVPGGDQHRHSDTEPLLVDGDVRDPANFAVN